MTFNVLKKPDVFYIGKQDENGAETIDIDYSAWIERYGDGVITATFQGAEDAAPYDIVLTTANGVATWTVTKANTAAAGVGKLQLNYVVDEVVAKSLIWTVRVYPSMRASGEAPDGYQDWLTALQGLSAETQQNAQNAANSATEAEEYAEQAKASADSITGLTVEAETLPAGSSATASFDADTDKLSLGIPRGDKGEKGDTGQDGITPDLTIGTTETLPAGSSATATITGTKENPVLNLGIPQGTQGVQGERGGKGDTGATPDISIGTVETLNPDESATATITGTAEDPVLNLGIPKGDAGADGFSPSATVTKQDGNIVITVTDKDGTTSETLEVDDALDETSENPVQNAAIVEAMRSMLPVDTASGAIASFPDGADDVPMLSLKAQIEPVQDLHGYDSPWPAGGGKNVMHPVTAFTLSENLTVTNDNGKITINGSATQGSTVYLAFDSMTIQEGYIVALMNSFVNATIYFLKGMTQVDYFTLSTVNRVINTASMATLYGKEFDKIRILFNGSVTLSNANFSLMVVLDGADTSTWTPYENICPISGWTEVHPNISGINVWDEEWEVGTLNNTTGLPYEDNNNIRAKNYIPCLPDTAYYFFSGSGKTLRYYWYDADYNLIDNNTAVNAVRTSPSNARYFKVRTTQSYGSTYNHDISINYPSTDHSYHPYTGRSINIQLGQTVYGGTLDVVSGELVVDRAMVDLGTLPWAHRPEVATGIFSSALTGYKTAPIGGRIKTQCSQYVFLAMVGSAHNTHAIDKSYSFFYSGGYVYVYDTSYSDPTVFKTAMNNVQLVYELATPQTYQLTPQEVRTFLGANNIWSDTGDTEVSYRADIQKYIEKKVNG